MRCPTRPDTRFDSFLRSAPIDDQAADWLDAAILAGLDARGLSCPTEEPLAWDDDEDEDEDEDFLDDDEDLDLGDEEDEDFFEDDDDVEEDEEDLLDDE